MTVATTYNRVVVEDADIHFAIGSRLAEARRRAGLTQVAVAKDLGVSQSHVARLELGRRRLTLAEATRFAACYSVEVGDFIPRQEPEGTASTT
jgi:transcriptional regulator with XRE-family HTH domain